MYAAKQRRTATKAQNQVDQTQQQLADALKSLDTDGDGFLTMEEFRKGVSKLGIHLQDHEIQQIWESVDGGQQQSSLPVPEQPAGLPTKENVVENAAPIFESSEAERQAAAGGSQTGTSAVVEGDSMQARQPPSPGWDRVPAVARLKQEQNNNGKVMQQRAQQNVERAVMDQVSARPRQVVANLVEATGTFVPKNCTTNDVLGMAEGAQLDFLQFRTGLSKAGLQLGDDDVELIWDKFGGFESGTVCAAEFARHLSADQEPQEGEGNANRQHHFYEMDSSDATVGKVVYSSGQEALDFTDVHDARLSLAQQRIMQEVLSRRKQLAKDLKVSEFEGQRAVDSKHLVKSLTKAGLFVSDADAVAVWKTVAGNATEMNADEVIAKLLDLSKNPGNEFGQHPARHLKGHLRSGFVTEDNVGEFEAVDKEQSKAARKEAATETRLFEALQRRREDVQAIFSQGAISLNEFHSGLQQVGLYMAMDDVRRMWMQSTGSSAGKMDWDDAKAALKLDDRANYAGPEFDKSRPVTSAPTMQRIVDYKLREQLNTKMRDVQYLFNTFESRGVSGLNRRQLQLGLSSIGIFMGTADAESIFSRVSKDGVVTFDDIKQVVHQPANPQASSFPKLTKKLVKELEQSGRGMSVLDAGSVAGSDVNTVAAVKHVLGKISRSDVGNAVRFKHLFVKFDPDRAGQVSHSELRQVLASAELKLTRREFLRLTKSLDPENSGFIMYNQLSNALDQYNSAPPTPMLNSETRSVAGGSVSSFRSSASASSVSSAFGSSSKADRSGWLYSKQNSTAIDPTRESGRIPEEGTVTVLRLTEGAPLPPSMRQQ